MSGQVEALAFAIRRANNACDAEADFLASDWLRDHDRALRESIVALADEMDAGGDWDRADVGARLRVLARGEQP